MSQICTNLRRQDSSVHSTKKKRYTNVVRNGQRPSHSNGKPYMEQTRPQLQRLESYLSIFSSSWSMRGPISRHCSEQQNIHTAKPLRIDIWLYKSFKFFIIVKLNTNVNPYLLRSSSSMKHAIMTSHLSLLPNGRYVTCQWSAVWQKTLVWILPDILRC